MAPADVITFTTPLAPALNFFQLLSCTLVQALRAWASDTMPGSPKALAYHSPHNWSLMMRVGAVLPVSI
jgi:hypothetical protein